MKNNRMCRLCLSTNGEMEKLFSSPEISEEIFNCTNIKITRISGLPDCICELCKSELTTSAQFKRKCVQADEILRKKYPDRFKTDFLIKMDPDDVYSDVADSVESESNFDEVEYIEESVKSENFDDEAPNSESSYMIQVLDLKFEPLDETKLAEELQKEQRENGDEDTHSECENTINLQNTSTVNQTSSAPQSKEALKSPSAKRPKYRNQSKCTICGKFQLNMKQHMLVHSDQFPFRCPYCNHGFRQRSNFKHHVYIHTGEKPYQCELCDKAFSDPASLRSHKVRHTGERRYQCELCNKAFGYSHTLAAHRRIHTQDRRHKCEQCSKAFLSKHALKKHIRSHTGERPYKCNICPKSFATSGNLTTHQRVHTKERPYRCNLCAQDFSYKCVLNTHMKKHIREAKEKQDLFVLA